MKLPNAHDAIVDDTKLRDYCLNEWHEVGKHKAVVFKSALGLTSSNWIALKTAILDAATTCECEVVTHSPHGNLYTMDFVMTHLDKRASVRTGWIVRHNENFPRLTSCYVISHP